MLWNPCSKAAWHLWAPFQPKSNFAYALGLVDRKIFASLNILRQIRNHCAHTAEWVEVDETRIQSIFDQLPETSQEIVGIIENVAKGTDRPLQGDTESDFWAGHSHARIRFQVIASVILAKIKGSTSVST